MFFLFNCKSNGVLGENYIQRPFSSIILYSVTEQIMTEGLNIRKCWFTKKLNNNNNTNNNNNK